MNRVSLTPQTNSGSAATDDLVAVELVGVTKRFPGVLANDDVNLAVRHGEVHCLLGENGAGKSTLMAILSGMLSPDAGHIRVDGQQVDIGSPRHALQLGIGTVYQHSALVPALTVLQNLMLGDTRGLTLRADAARKRLRELAESLGIEVDPDAQLQRLSLGQQQQVEIIKALWRGSRVLILDEPTSMLTPQGVTDLQTVLVRLKGQGLAIIFITHKLHEAFAIGDRVSILKQGRIIASLDQETLKTRSHDELQSLVVDTMFGEDARVVANVAELQGEIEEKDGARELSSETVLELAQVSALGDNPSGGVHGATFTVHYGEIFGVAGVDGNGQRELAQAIAGQRSITDGTILLNGQAIHRLSVARRQQLGLRYVTDDRLGEGIVGSLSVALNIMLKRIGQTPFWKRGVIQHRVLDDAAQDLVEKFDVRPARVTARAGTLSGGNIQKVILARELSFDPRMVVYNKPTQGLDVKTTRAVRQRIREQARNGVTAVVISTDLDELLEMCDRIAVLYRGRITGTVENGVGAGERIGELMIGGKAA